MKFDKNTFKVVIGVTSIETGANTKQLFFGRHQNLPSIRLDVEGINRFCDDNVEVTSLVEIRNHDIVRSPCVTDLIHPISTMCGKKSIDRIVHGQVVTPNSWPWIVGISQWSQNDLNNDDFPVNCSGTIIDDRWVLTAAHCCERGVKFTLLFGDHNRDKKGETEGTEQQMIIDNAYYIHPNRDQIACEENNSADSCSNKYCNFDVCLLHTPESIGIGSKQGVASACLPKQEPNPNDSCWVAGWGKTSEHGPTSSELRSVGVSVFSAEDCEERHACDNFELNNDEFCAGDEGGDSCSGDSGGPLICENDDLLTLTGIVSRGYGCAQANYPGIYGDVFEYIDWIDNVMNHSTKDKEPRNG